MDKSEGLVDKSEPSQHDNIRSKEKNTLLLGSIFSCFDMFLVQGEEHITLGERFLLF
jgi:hypothetical protein